MRRRLVLFSLATASMVLVAFMVPLVLSVQRLAREQAVDDALRRVQVVAPLLTSLPEPEVERELRREAAGRPPALVVGLPDGRTVGEGVVPGDAEVVRVARERQQVVRAPGPDGALLVTLPVRRVDGTTTVVRTLVPREAQRRGVAQAYVVLGITTAVLLGLIALVASRFAGRLATPVERLADAARRLQAGDLAARVDVPDEPDELRDVARAFNDLAERVAELLAEEREAVASLSHRLRTPLTALRLDVERLPDARAAARLPGTVDSLVAAVDEVIREARRNAEDARQRRADLREVVAGRLSALERLGATQDRSFELHAPRGRFRVDASSRELADAVDALLTNVLQHTPPGTSCRISLEHRDDGRSVLVVEDDGPGLVPDVLLARGTSTSGSTGLGLDIARRVASGSGGGLWLARSPSGGARVELELGAPRSPAAAAAPAPAVPAVPAPSPPTRGDRPAAPAGSSPTRSSPTR